MHRGRGHAVGGCAEEGREPRGHWLHVHSDLEGVIEVSDVPRPGSRGREQVVLARICWLRSDLESRSGLVRKYPFPIHEDREPMYKCVRNQFLPQLIST